MIRSSNVKGVFLLTKANAIVPIKRVKKSSLMQPESKRGHDWSERAKRSEADRDQTDRQRGVT